MKVTHTWLESRREPRNRPQTRYDVTVDGREGLMARVFPSGVVSFRFRYRRGGRRLVMVLGEFGPGGLSLADAFDAHHQAQKEIAKGLDPIEERARRLAEAERARLERSAADTIASLVEQFVHRKLRAERWDADGGRWVRDSRANIKARKRPYEAAALLGYVEPEPATPGKKRRTKRKAVETLISELGSLKARDVSRRQLITFLDGIVERGAPVTANRVHALLVQLFTWAAAKDLIPASPMAGVERPGGEERPRQRVLSAVEVNTFWAKLTTADMAEPTRLALKLLLVTAQRRGELTFAKWSHFDLAGKLWTIPVELLKTSHPGDRRRSPMWCRSPLSRSTCSSGSTL